MVPSLPLLSCESSVSVKKTLIEKKAKKFTKIAYYFTAIVKVEYLKRGLGTMLCLHSESGFF